MVKARIGMTGWHLSGAMGNNGKPDTPHFIPSVHSISG